MIGESYKVVDDLVFETGKVDEFARAVGDDNPAHLEAAAAAQQSFDAIPAPLTFTRTAYFPGDSPEGVEEHYPFDLGFEPTRRIHGEHEHEFKRPIAVRGVLSDIITLADVYQREGRRGWTLTFAVYEVAYYDQNNELIFTERWTSIETGRAVEEGRVNE